MKKGVIGADHEFHDMQFALGWAERFVPTPERLTLFNVILSELYELIPENGRVVELGIGPGYLADYLLQAMPDIKYQGLDFSGPMLDIARKRLNHHTARITFTQVDLLEDAWDKMLLSPIDAIVSTWTLHDLGSQQNVASVYARSAVALADQGILLNGDFVKPDGTTHEFEAGRFPIARHLDLLESAGFSEAECLILLEEEIDCPTPAQNYACFKALK